MAEYVVAVTDGLLWAAPERVGTPVGGLPRDTLARVLDRNGDWIRVETEHEQQGWVEHRAIRLLDNPALDIDQGPLVPPSGFVAAPQPPPPQPPPPQLPRDRPDAPANAQRGRSVAKGGSGIQPWLVIGGMALLAIFVALRISSPSSTTAGGGSMPTLSPAPTATPDSAFRRKAAHAADPRQITADPKTWQGSNVVLWGRALTVNQQDDYTWVQFMAEVAGRPFVDEPIALVVRPRTTGILTDDCYIAYGIVGDTQSVTRLLTGASNDIPAVDVYALDATGAPLNDGSCRAPKS
jgi:hypothetical protein